MRIGVDLQVLDEASEDVELGDKGSLCVEALQTGDRRRNAEGNAIDVERSDSG